MVSNKILEKLKIEETNYKNINFDKDIYRLNYHIIPPYGLLNDPNGFIFYKGNYHLFYQWNPFGCCHKNKFWAHLISSDLCHWKRVKPALIPDQWYEKNGCYSGSAIENSNKLYLIYTGNVKHNNGKRNSYQCVAHSNDGTNFKKLGPVIDNPPNGFTMHFRDPKIWKKNDMWHMVLGAQTVNKEGRVLRYTSKNLKNWEYRGEIAGSNINGLGYFGYMWECPDFFHLGEVDILLVSPQGVKTRGDRFNNIHQSGYFIGTFNYKTNKFIHGEFFELDRGFEFYAPQTTIDSKNRRLLFAWMGLPGLDEHPTIESNWIHAMTIPRQLVYKNSKIYQIPVKELECLRKSEILCKNILLEDSLTLDGINGDSYELIATFNNIKSDCGIKLRVGKNEETVIYLDSENKKLVLDRSRSGRGYKGVRKCPIKNIDSLKLHIFVDKSSIEIFVNDGEEVFTARIYPNQKSKKIMFFSNDKCVLEKVSFYRI